MADRYWVGGSGSWDSTAKWSTTSGGVSGASVPTASDNAIFNAASGGSHYTVTVTDNATCANLTFTPVSSTGVTQFSVGNGFVITGTFSTSGTQGNRRVWFRSSTYGLMRDMQIAAIGSVSDVDFRDIRITGTGGTLTGTRIGDLRGCRGITFSTPKTVYWNLAGAQNWSATGWSDTPTGTPSNDFFPLAQDTATFTDAGLVTGTITTDAAIPYMGTVDMSGRTSAMAISIGGNQLTIYGDWINGSGTTVAGFGTLTFSGRNTQTITSAGKLFAVNLIVDSYGGTVELADAFTLTSSYSITVTNGTFDTKNYNVTASSLSSSDPNVRTITLGSSTLTFTGSLPINFNIPTNLTLNAGTSEIISTSTGEIAIFGGGMTFYNLSITGTTSLTNLITGSNIFNNLTLTAPTSAGLRGLRFSGNPTITGTLTVAGASAVRRIFIYSNTLGTTRTLTVNTLSASDCDFQDITLAGAAAGASPTRAGDCGGNSGITFPAAKTVYWNLAGAQDWSATAWASSTGGSPDINNFPLAQDTAVFDEAAGSVTGTITINAAWNIGTFDASARTSAMTLAMSTTTPTVYGDWKFGTGVTSSSSSGTLIFSARGTGTITSNGVTFGCQITINCFTGTINLADALSLDSTRTLSMASGAFDAVSYNVTTGLFSNSSPFITIKMGSGTWTLSGYGSVWGLISSPNAFYKGTADIVLSYTGIFGRTFSGNGLSYNKLTIGGTTGTSTLTINGNNQFTELASTKTVAHTIALGTTTQTFGKWTVTGTSGNVVTLTGTGSNHILAGACTDGIDYLAMGSIGFSASSPGEFYAGANSTGAAGAPVYRTAKPADSTRYWVGGTGNWSDTARWSTSSGGASGASVPRSHDDVVFDSASNATAYTATVNTVTGGVRMKSLTISGPASGNVTLAGTTAIVGIHGNVTLPATGLTRTYTGAMTLSGSSTGRTFTTNGVTLASAITVNGVGCGWSLGSALNAGSSDLIVTNGSFDLATYNLTAGAISSNNANSRTIDFDTGTTTLSNSISITFGTTETNRANLTVISSTSQINLSNQLSTFYGNKQNFYNVSYTNTIGNGTLSIYGENTFNNISIAGPTNAGLVQTSLYANQTITGTLTLSAGTNATMRHFLRSDVMGETRTLTVAAFSGTDVDFRDITITGAAAPVSGTRLGDCKGNSGVIFAAPKTVYVRSTGSNNWSSVTGWSATQGGVADVTQFPLAQDTVVFPAATYPASGSTITIDRSYNIGTIDMSLRTVNTVTLSTGFAAYSIYGNWINGTGTNLVGSGVFVFSGRGSQTITSAGRTFTQGFSINTPGGSVSLNDAFVTSTSNLFQILIGTFNAVSYNVSLPNSPLYSGSATNKTIGIGSGTWTLGASGTPFESGEPSNTTITGTGTISLTSASTKNFIGRSNNYSNITLNQGGVGILGITGNNIFKTISSTAAGPSNISIGTATQRITTSWTATGTAGNILTIQGSSSTSPGTLIFTGAGTAANVDYLNLVGVRAYNLGTTWLAGANSINNGSLGWYFFITSSISETSTGSDSISTIANLFSLVSEVSTGQDTISVSGTLSSLIFETSAGSDLISVSGTLPSLIFETSTGSDSISVAGTFPSLIFESSTGQDTITPLISISRTVQESSRILAAPVLVAAIFNASLVDVSTGSDKVFSLATLPTAIDESAVVVDGYANFIILPTIVNESSTASETVSVFNTFNSSILEQVTGIDSFLIAPSIFNVVVPESVVARDVVGSSFLFLSTVSEAVTALDIFSSAYLWTDVDDSQGAIWANVNNSQGSVWTDVNGSQGAIWANVNNSQGGVWTDVDDSQGSVWSPVIP